MQMNQLDAQVLVFSQFFLLAQNHMKFSILDGLPISKEILNEHLSNSMNTKNMFDIICFSEN